MKKLLACLAILAVAAPALAQSQNDPAVFHRDDLVRMKSKSPAYALRVIAVPGDRLSMDKSGISVNEVAVPGTGPELSDGQEPSNRSMLIPEGHYYVFGEQRITSGEGENVSQHWGLHPGANLERLPK